jgi:hypothetical protein
MNRLLCGLLLITACGREVTVPASLRLEPFWPVGCLCFGPPSASGQFAVVGQTVTIELEVIDQSGNLVSGVSIHWAVARGNGLAAVETSVTDSIGRADVSWTLDTIAKLDSLVASIASGSSMLVTASGRHAAPIPATVISGDSQTIAAGTTSQPFVVRITDRYGNPIVGGAVAWSGAGEGTLSALTTSTDATGAASVTLKTVSAPGVYRVVATYPLIPATTFTVTAR